MCVTNVATVCFMGQFVTFATRVLDLRYWQIGLTLSAMGAGTFAAGLALVSRAASSRGTVQVLGGVGIRATDGLLELEATDMELSLRTTVQATVEGDGTLVVPAKLLGDIVRLLPGGDVTIAHKPEEGAATIEAGSYSSQRPSLLP